MNKKLIALAIAALAFSTTSWAQTAGADMAASANDGTCQCENHHKGKHHADRNGKRNDRRKQRPDFLAGIELTAEQQQAIDSMRQQNRREMMQAGKEAKENRKQQAEQARAKRTEQLRSILTPEQFAQYEQNVANAKSQAADRKKNRADGKQCKKAASNENCRARVDRSK